jgi:pimeloyl-ACP methyl ester carboxylesterase
LEKVIPGAELVVIDKCGHLPMIEQPKAYIDILKASL